MRTPTNPIRAARLSAGLTGEELAELVGITSAGVSRIETGKSRPSVGVLYALATELGMWPLADSLQPFVEPEPVLPAE